MNLIIFLVCVGCGNNPYETDNPLKRLRTNNFASLFDIEQDDDDDDDKPDVHDDDDDVIIVENAEQPKIKDKEEKKAEAVEKGMENHELIPYFNQYILLMREQRQKKKTFTEEQLHDYITDLFTSLQYKNDHSDGKIKRKFY
jgi:hypothetical protein